MKYLLVIVALGLSSCIPEERIWWSPNGEFAVVITDDQLIVTNQHGEISCKTEVRRDIIPMSASWLADSSAFICVRKRKLDRWQEMKASIPASEVEMVDQMMPTVLPLLEAAARTSTDVKNLEGFIAGMSEHARSILICAIMRSYEADSAKTLQALGKFDSLLRETDIGYEFHELCLVQPNALEKPRVITASLIHAPFAPLVSPSSRFYACLRLDPEGDDAALEIRSVDQPDQSLIVSGKASIAFDWTPDGRGVVFMSPIGSDNGPLYTIQQAEVLTEKSRLLGHDDLKVKTLATALCPDHARLAVLPDGRILFATQSVQLPAVHVDGQVDSQLYLLAPDSGQLAPLPTAPGALPAFPGHFAVSPDGKTLAVVESNVDAVAVVDLASGRTQLISEPHYGWKCRTLPSWRSSSELTYATIRDGKPHWVAWTESGGVRALSAQWPETMTKGWLEKSEPTKESP